MFVCPICGVENRENAKFCRKCGQSRTALEQHAAAAVAVTESEAAEPVASVNAVVQALDRLQATQFGARGGGLPGRAESRRVDLTNQTDPVSTPDTNHSEIPEPVVSQLATLSSEQRAQPQAVGGTTTPSAPAPAIIQSGNNEQKLGPGLPECPACWTVLRATDKFCCWCGEPQPNRILPTMKMCLDCHCQLPEKANFCALCGADVANYERRKVRVPLDLFDEESEYFPRFNA